MPHVDEVCVGTQISGWTLLYGFVLVLAGVPSDQMVQVITIWAVSSESLFIKQAFDSAAQANLIGMLLITHRPTHLPMPAAAKYQHSRSSYASCNQTERDLPAGLLFVRHQNQGTDTEQQLTLILAAFFFLAARKSCTEGAMEPKRNIAISRKPL